MLYRTSIVILGKKQIIAKFYIILDLKDLIEAYSVRYSPLSRPSIEENYKLLKERTDYGLKCTRPIPHSKKGIRPALHSPPPETHAGARSPEHPNISLFARRTSVLIILIKIPAPIIQHLSRGKHKDPDYFRNQGPYQKRQLPTLPHCIAVPSAQPGLTSLFGMGRGGTPAQ